MTNEEKKAKQITNFSYWFFGAFCILLIMLKLNTPLLTILFSFLALQFFTIKGYRSISVVLFFLVVITIFLGFAYSINHVVITLPGIVEKALPAIIHLADSYEIKLPFTDIDSLKTSSVYVLKTELSSFANFAKLASKEFIYLIIGIAIAVGLFVTPRIDIENEKNIHHRNLYSAICLAITHRFQNFFLVFKKVMGAQIIISLINTSFTGIFLYVENLPHFELLITITFLCGLLPIIGNIISNSIIFFVAATISSTLAIHAIVFLIILHKAEYFLNSKIIGRAIKNPMWLTLLALVIGERIMGIPGLILAPVFLNYIKQETRPVIL